MGAKRPGIGAATTPAMGDMGGVMMRKGGTASARADGIASKGKTKGKWC